MFKPVYEWTVYVIACSGKLEPHYTCSTRKRAREEQRRLRAANPRARFRLGRIILRFA